MSISSRPWFRAGLVTSAVVGLTTLARADAPSTQYDYFDQNDTVIEDKWTKLTWQRYPPATGVTFDEAAAYCASTSTDAGPQWRVPSYKELLTLVDESPHYDYEDGQLVMKAIDPNAFPQIPANLPYWTSSPYPGSSGSAYAIDFHTGVSSSQDMSVTYYVRCVY